MRAAQVAVLLTATTIAGMGAAAPAVADVPAHPTRAVAAHSPAALPALGLCVDLDLPVLLRIRLVIGECHDDEPPHEPDPPEPTPAPPPTPTRPPPPVKPRPPSPAPPRPTQTVSPVRTPRLVALPRVPEPTPSATTHRPTPSPVTSGYQAPLRRAAAPPNRRRPPLGTVMVLVVLSTVIASGAGLAFASHR